MENSEKQDNIEVQNEEIPFEHPVQVQKVPPVNSLDSSC